MKSALLIVDIQNDFCPKGALPVKDGDKVVAPANALIRHFQKRDQPVFLTRDWHPADHCSFREFGGPWPAHCVAGTQGAAFHSSLEVPENAVIISKAAEPDKEAYSSFEGTDLASRLKQAGVEHVILAGLTTDYCVRNTALDALKNGFSVTVVSDGIRAVNVQPEDGKKAIAEMKARGVAFMSLAEIVD